VKVFLLELAFLLLTAVLPHFFSSFTHAALDIDLILLLFTQAKSRKILKA
jgi:hypothetical protein